MIDPDDIARQIAKVVRSLDQPDWTEFTRRYREAEITLAGFAGSKICKLHNCSWVSDINYDNSANVLIDGLACGPLQVDMSLVCKLAIVRNAEWRSVGRDGLRAEVLEIIETQEYEVVSAEDVLSVILEFGGESKSLYSIAFDSSISGDLA